MHKTINSTQAYFKIFGLLIVGIWVLAFGSPQTAQAAAPDSNQPTMVVSGNSQIKAAPDMASISLAVVNIQANLSDAQNENNRNTMQLIQALKNLGLSDRDVNTVSYNVWPQYHYYDNGKTNNLTPEITGYRIQNEIEVTVKDIDKIGIILDAALKNGANNIGSIRFDKANKVADENEALGIAIKNAHSKAVSMASALGMKLGGVVNVSESGFKTILPLNSINFESRIANDAKAMGEVPIQAGQINIEASVVITYHLIP